MADLNTVPDTQNDSGDVSTSSDPSQQNFLAAPAYMQAADNHNFGNSNFSFFDPSTWEDKADNVAKFAVSAAVSGATSFYNTGAAVGNWLEQDNDIKPLDNSSILSDLDSDLGAYYNQNKQSADLAGFIATSLLPGVGGVKILNAGQKALMVAREGWVGTNLGRATGLLVPDAERAVAQAATEMATSTANFNLINSGTVNALARGFGQAALESAAFETAVAATMKQSPIMQDQDFGDIMSNIAVGTALGGVIGGAITGAGIFGTIKGAIRTADAAFAPVTSITELGSGVSAANKIISYTEDLKNLGQATAQTQEDFVNNYVSKISGIEQTPEASDQLWQKFQSLAGTKENKLNNLIRDQYQELVPGKDAELGNFVADSLQGLDATTVQANLTHLEQVGRIGSKLSTESDIIGAAKKLETSGAQAAIDETGAVQLSKRIGYVKLTGENAGNVSFDVPKVLSIADTEKSATDVMSVVKKTANASGWSAKNSPVWDALDPSVTPTQAEARYLWADRLAKPVQDGQVIGQHDFPMLEKAYSDPKVGNINISSSDGSQYNVTRANLYNEIKQSKLEAANQLLASQRAGVSTNVESIAKITNLKQSYLEGSASGIEANDLFARQAAKSDYAASLISKGLNPKLADDMDLKPTYLKAGYNTQPFTDLNGTQLEGIAHVMAQQKVHVDALDMATSKAFGDLNDRFWRPGQNVLTGLDRLGAGPKVFSFAQGIYHSAASWAESIGQGTAALERKFIQGTHDQLDAVAYKLSQKLDAAIEFQGINNKMASTTEKYVLNDAGDGLIARSIQKYNEDVQAGKQNLTAPKLQDGAAPEIPFVNPETRDAWITHIRLNGTRISTNKEIHAAQGLEDAKDSNTAYPIRPNPKDYNHFAFVRDPSVTGVGHMSMIHAPDADTLEKLIQKVPDTLDVIRKGESEEYHGALRDFNLDRTLHENYIDSTLHSKGINSQFFQQTDPVKIANDFLNWHLNQDRTLAKTVVSAKFDPEFSQIRRTAEQYGLTNTSRYGDAYSDIKDVTKDPFLSYIKTALNINQQSDYPMLRGLNTILDQKFSQAINSVGRIFQETKSAADLGAVNDALDRFGIKSAYYDSAINTLVNRGADQGVLRDWIRKANSMLSSLTVRLNPINALNNVIGSTVLLGPETRILQRQMLSSPAAMQAFKDLTSTSLPGTADSIFTSGKLIQNAIASFWRDMGEGKGALSTEYSRQGIMPHGITDEIRQIMDDGTISGGEKTPDLGARLGRMYDSTKALMQKAEVWSGNRMSEQFNRFVAAHVSHQITDPLVSAGLLDAGAAQGIRNTFVNRVHGNLLASQRPILFQGPIGQSISLFQSYQFNMIQQLLRMVGEGNGKDAAMALGLQGTIYGMSGLPGFNFINQHIVGTASGNPNHRDLYDAVYGTIGKPTADWLMYGLPSNLLQTNIYAHGDMNPRQVTLVPTNPSDIPIIKAYGSFFGSLKDTATKIMGGGNAWESILQGIEHAGIIRPLAGLAQTLQATTNDARQAYSTTDAGNILGTNDLFSFATLSRLAGGTPLDEAMMKDATYRYTAYQASDKNKQDNIAEALKSTVIGGQQPSMDQINHIAGNYAALGGGQKNFNKFMIGQIKDANTSQANQIMQHLKNPYASTMQQIMGGSEVPDGRSITPAYTASSSTPNYSGQ